jgi:hypothetical protein
MPYAQPHLHQSVSHSPYSQSMAQHSSMYEPRHNYYQEPQVAVYPGYDRLHDSYYARPSYPGYDNAYGDIRFQQHVGLDHNAFNRKRRGNLPKEATNILKDWFTANRQSPYPTEDQKMDLCSRTGLSLNQVRYYSGTTSALTVLLHLPFLSPSVTLLRPQRAIGPSAREPLGRSYTICPLSPVEHADSKQVSNWFINARRRAPQKEQRERETNGPDA